VHRNVSEHLVCSEKVSSVWQLAAQSKLGRPSLKYTHEYRRVLDHADRYIMATNVDVSGSQSSAGHRGGLAHFFRNDELAIEDFGHVLQARRDIHGIAQRGENRAPAKAHITDDDLSGVNADAVIDRLRLFIFSFATKNSEI
jgi:hypothetical protein